MFPFHTFSSCRRRRLTSAQKRSAIHHEHILHLFALFIHEHITARGQAGSLVGVADAALESLFLSILPYSKTRILPLQYV
eukprot:1910474-Pyramimonas_sp.AAC.1